MLLSEVWADYRLHVKTFGARIDIQEFVRLLELRAQGEKIVIAKAVTDVFKLDPQSAEERHCRDLVLRYEPTKRTACRKSYSSSASA